MSEPILVVIFLRGGADSLALCAPTADPAYIAARPPTLRTLRDGICRDCLSEMRWPMWTFAFTPRPPTCKRSSRR